MVNFEKDASKEKQEPQQDDALKQTEEYKDLLQRIQADFENYKKRCEKEISEQKEYSTINLVTRLLPVLDSFELALKHASPNDPKFVDGVKGIYAQLYSVLESLGLRKIDAVGKQFDPYKHEVLLVDEEGADGKVLEELQKGYMLKNAVIRHSKVKIGKKTDNQQGEKK